jgi:hypothetical protein
VLRRQAWSHLTGRRLFTYVATRPPCEEGPAAPALRNLRKVVGPAYEAVCVREMRHDQRCGRCLAELALTKRPQPTHRLSRSCRYFSLFLKNASM